MYFECGAEVHSVELCKQHWRTCSPVLRRALFASMVMGSVDRARLELVRAFARADIALRSGYFRGEQGRAYVVHAVEALSDRLNAADRYYGSQLMVRLRRSSGRGL